MERYFDFHTHPHLYADTREISTVSSGLPVISLGASVDTASYAMNKEIAGAIDSIIPTFGIHPFNAADYKGSLGELDEYIDESPVIGEIGLDYLWAPQSSFEAQHKIFRYIAKRCVDTDKYMVLHTKDAEEDILRILRDMNAQKVIIHWYAGPAELFREYVGMGWYFTFGPELKYSEHIRGLVGMVPKDRLLSETDNPVAEKWLTGRKGVLADISEVVNVLSETLSFEADHIMDILGDNSMRILKDSGISL